MSNEQSEQNTQRTNSIEEYQQSVIEAARKAITPAPQTEAGDVEEMALKAAREIAENTDAASIAARGPRFIFEEYIHEQQEVIIEHFKPLARRIAELQAEVHHWRAHYEAATGNWNECLARVKELEQKLAGALKVTTENTIAHMQGKP